MQLRTYVTKDDLLKGSRFAYTKIPKSIVINLLMFAVILLVLDAVIFYVYDMLEVPSFMSWIVSGGLDLYFSFRIYYMTFVNQKKMIKTMQKKGFPVLGESTVGITPEYIYQDRHQWKWDKVLMFRETDEFMMVFVQFTYTVFIPKRDFATPGDAETFAYLAKSYLEQAKGKKKQ